MKRPRVKPALYPVRLTRSLIRVGGNQPGLAAELPDDDGALWRLMQLADGSRDAGRIVSDLAAERPDLATDGIAEALQGLMDEGLIEDAQGPRPNGLTEAETHRYEPAAHYFAYVDTSPRESRFEAQARVKAAAVTVCGLGGSGTAVAASLVAAGVGRVHCVDFDRVEEANLTRQLLYTEQDIGRSKVDAAVEKLRQMNRFVDVTGQERCIGGQDDLEALMHDRHLLILCADTPAGRIQEWATTASLSTGTPVQFALYSGPMLITSIWSPALREGCRSCIPRDEVTFEWLHGHPPLEALYDKPPHAVLAPTANLAGHLAALEALYFLSGLRPTSLGRILCMSLIDLTFRYLLEPQPYPECLVCGRVAR